MVTPDGAMGLTAAEAARRLATVGQNAVEEPVHPAWRKLTARLWGPLPWMLEVTIVLTLMLGKHLEAGIITLLLVVNAVVGFQQNAKADRALALLRTKLAVNARVLRDGQWQTLPARRVVPGDVVRVRVGDLVPADLAVFEGQLSCDQSALTGESMPVDIVPGAATYGASVVTRGEATGIVTATGAASFSGRTTQLVQTTQAVTHLEQIVLRVVRYLVAVDVLLVALMFGFALVVGTPVRETLPFALIILIASVPIALPTTFTVAQAVGAVELSRGQDARHRGHGVLVTRLSALQESASMDVLCTDKTGTITSNHLELTAAVPYPPFDSPKLVELAALASDQAGQDPIDLAILAGAAKGGFKGSDWRRVGFVPFDPATKRTEATIERAGEHVVVVKGMPEVVARASIDPPLDVTADVVRLASGGARVLAVATGQPGQLRMAGLIALADQVRPDAAQLVQELASLGVQVKMITGDTAATALAVAGQVGIDGPVCTREELRSRPEVVHQRQVFAEMFPEDKFAIVSALQAAGRVVGMTGDGVNDAPALKRAEVGIAVDSAVDVAKAVASLVLTEPGLVGVVTAVRVSRSIYQRMLTWTLNKIIKTFQVALFLTLSFFVTRDFVITPFLMVLLLFANDFITMALAVDRARPSPAPDRWPIHAIVGASAALSFVVLAEAFLDLYLGRVVLGLALPELQTMTFAMLVFTGQATVYVVRERGRLWASRPSGWLLLASGVDVFVVSMLTSTGTFMTAIGLPVVLLVLGVAITVAILVMDPAKAAILRRLKIS